MIAIGISEEAIFRHENANHFCLEVLKNCIVLDRFNLVEYNNKEPGVIFIQKIGLVNRIMQK